LKISRGTIFGRDYSAHTKPPCESLDNSVVVPRLRDGRPSFVSAVRQTVKILLLQLKRIGDLILTTPVIAALRERFPEAEVTIVVSSECADLLPAISDVDRILMARRNLSDFAAFLAVAGNKFDYCIDFTRNDPLRISGVLVRSPETHRVHTGCAISRKVAPGFTLILVNVRMRDLHTIDYNLSLLEPLGIGGVSSSLHLQLPQSAHEKADELRRNWNVSKPYIVLHPGSARQEKLWEAGRWARVIERFGRDNDLDLILTSGASKHEQAHIAAIKNETKIIDLSGKTDLLTLAALIGEARLLVTVDSAPMHLAAATHTPQVILFGPTNPLSLATEGKSALILQGKTPRPVTEFSSVQPRVPMSQISTEAVISAMDFLLSQHAAARTS